MLNPPCEYGCFFLGQLASLVDLEGVEPSSKQLFLYESSKLKYHKMMGGIVSRFSDFCHWGSFPVPHFITASHFCLITIKHLSHPLLQAKGKTNPSLLTSEPGAVRP